MGLRVRSVRLSASDVRHRGRAARSAWRRGDSCHWPATSVRGTRYEVRGTKTVVAATPPWVHIPQPPQLSTAKRPLTRKVGRGLRFARAPRPPGLPRGSPVDRAQEGHGGLLVRSSSQMGRQRSFQPLRGTGGTLLDSVSRCGCGMPLLYSRIPAGVGMEWKLLAQLLAGDDEASVAALAALRGGASCIVGDGTSSAESLTQINERRLRHTRRKGIETLGLERDRRRDNPRADAPDGALVGAGGADLPAPGQRP